MARATAQQAAQSYASEAGTDMYVDSSDARNAANKQGKHCFPNSITWIGAGSRVADKPVLHLHINAPDIAIAKARAC